MAHVHSKKRTRDALTAADWQMRGDEAYAKLGLTREHMLSILPKFQGTMVWPDDTAYETDRKLFNPVFDAYPVLIMYCAVESDVQIALEVAKKVPQPFTVRSGGHCTAGFSAGAGVLIDVSALNDVYVDPQGLTATVGCGCNFGKFRAVLKPYELHVPGGECDDVCIGGYMQGGGYGFTSVTLGMNCDNVLSIRVLLADGRIVTASPNVNYDLWWAMRGGTGGSLGILLSVTYKLVPLGNVFGWAIIWPLSNDNEIDNAVNAFHVLETQYMATAPSPNLNIQVSLCFQPGIQAGLPLPPAPMQPYLLVRGIWVGDAISGQAAIQTLCNLPGATKQWTQETDFDTLNESLLNVPYGMPCFHANVKMPFEDKSSRIVSRTLTTAEWKGLLSYFVSTPNPYSYFYMEFYGGAINAYPEFGSAFVHRTALYNAVLDVFWWTDAERGPAQKFLDGWIALMQPLYNGHVYQNYPRLSDTHFAYKYWGDAQAALKYVKKKYDPNVFFTFAQCITQRGETAAAATSLEKFPKELQRALSVPIIEDAYRKR
jgi:FAD binding domain/Berberine and berberine like